MESLRYLAAQVLKESDHKYDTLSDGTVLPMVTTAEEKKIERINRSISFHDFGRFIAKSVKHLKSLSDVTNPEATEQDCASSLSNSLERLSLFYRCFLTSVSDRGTTSELLQKPSLIGTQKKSISEPVPCFRYWAQNRKKKNVRSFLDGSKYLGEWNSIGFAGKGIYRYPHGVIYDGNFNDNGEFHDFGTLLYPSGQKIEGYWKNGKLTKEVSFSSEDGLTKENTDSKRIDILRDRRYPIETQTGMGSPEHELVTANQPIKTLQTSCYDIGIGEFNAHKYVTTDYEKDSRRPKIKTVDINEEHKIYHELEEIELDEETQEFLESLTSKEKDISGPSKFPEAMKDLRMIDEENKKIREIPLKNQGEWIKKYCRSQKDTPVGYYPELYEVFASGRHAEMDNIEKQNIASTYLDKYPQIIRGATVEQALRPMFSVFKDEKIKYPRRKTLMDLEKPNTKKFSMRSRHFSLLFKENHAKK